MNSTNNLDFAVESKNIFSEEDHGKPIEEQLSIILRRNVSKNDYANIAIQSKVSLSTIRDVVYRNNSLTKTNVQGIELLMHAALANCVALKLQVKDDIMFLSNLLKR